MSPSTLTVECPAGHEVNPPGVGFSVVCGVIERENRDEGGPEVMALVDGRADRSSLAAYCCASGYVDCPVWRMETARREQGRHTIDADDLNYGYREPRNRS